MQICKRAAEKLSQHQIMFEMNFSQSLCGLVLVCLKVLLKILTPTAIKIKTVNRPFYSYIP